MTDIFADSEIESLNNKIKILEEENRKLKKNRNDFLHLKRVYESMRKINGLIADEKDRDILIRDACEILIKNESYHNAIIVLFDGGGNYETAAGAGRNGDLDIIGNNIGIPSCCMQARDGGFFTDVVSSDKCGSCPMVGNCENLSVLSVRLEFEDRLYGILSVAMEPEYLDNEEEQKIFREIAEELGRVFYKIEFEEKSRLLTHIVKKLPHTLSFISEDYIYVAVNDVYTSLYNMPVEKIVGKEVAVFFSEEVFTEQIKPMLDRCLSGEYVDYNLEVHFPTLGSQWMHMYYYPYFDRKGRVTGIVAHGMNITERKIAEEKLSVSEYKYRHLVETATDAITQISEDGVITEVNEYTCIKLGRKREEMVGMPVSVMDVEYSPSSFRKFWAGKEFNKKYIFESVHRKKNGQLFPVEISGSKCLVNGKPYIISIARDITDRKRNENDLQQALVRAEEADRLKSAFLANMSHEIRTPLNGILGFASLMNDPEITPAKQIQYHEIIKKSGKRLLNTINDLIDISRIESGLVELEQDEVDINRMMGELYSFFKPEISDRNLEFCLDFRLPNGEHVIRTDGEKVYAVLMNLLKNAVKFTKKGEIGFGCIRTENKVQFHVKDTGIGISAEKQQDVFNRFIQADLSVTKPYEGSGLGLAISREYVEMLGGSIWLESEEGMGSTFFFTLPV